MKNLTAVFVAAIALCFHFSTVLAQLPGSTGPFNPTPIKSSDTRVATFSKLPELAAYALDTDNATEVHDDGTGKGCIIFPIKIGKRMTTTAPDEANYCWVYYDLKNLQSYRPIICHAKGSRQASGAAKASVVLKTPSGELLSTMLYDNNDLRIQSGTTPTARSYGDCVDGNYSGAKGAFAGAAAGSCFTGNIFGCAASAGWLAGTLIGCAL